MTTKFKRVILVCLVLFFSSPLWSAADGTSEPTSENSRETGSVASYKIQPEDVLSVSVWKEESLKLETAVRPDGRFSFPLIGDVQAAGKTAREIQQEIKNRLERYIPDAVVVVSVLKVYGNKVYVIGRVNKPGEIATGRYLDVLQALSIAGGLTPFASENNIKVLRKQDGQETIFPFRYADIRRGHHLEQNIVLESGDVILVP